MIFAILLLLTALAISVVAAYFSIVGLTLIFSAAPIPIAVMGSVLELGKLVTASFLYRWWNKLNVMMRVYFFASVIILSVITSLGIFGYLSKSYISDSASIFASETQLRSKQELLAVEKTRLDNLLLQQSQRADPNRRVERQIDESQTRIYELTTEIGKLRGEKNALSTEIGPIRYIAELIYDDGQLDTIDKAVRLIILALMFVFDPLAILLVVAANMQIKSLRFTKPKQKKIDRKSKHLVELDREDIFKIEEIAEKKSLKDLEASKKGLSITDKYHGIPKENG
jgi:hypothetical protein